MAARLLFSRSLTRCLSASSRHFYPVLRTQVSVQTPEALTVDELQDRLLNTIKLFDKVNPEKVTMEAHFLNDLGLDSLDVVEIVMFLEDEFDVEITDEEAEKLFVLKDAFELLKKKKSLTETLD